MGLSPYYDFEVDGVNPLYTFTKLSNGGSFDMAVDGSILNKSFTWTPPDNNIWYINKVVLFICDNGTNAPDDFGSITTGGNLTNGLQLIQDVGGTENEIVNLRSNMDLALFFKINHNPTNSGFLAANEATICESELIPNIQLNGTSDSFVAKVRDDLTGINFLRAGIITYRTV